MPPVRWKLFAVTTICLVQALVYTDAQIMQDAISMTSDGWRPILGTHKPSYYDAYSQNGDVKSEILSTLTPTQTLPTTQTPSPTPSKKTPFRASSKPSNTQGRKKNPHLKHPQLNPYFALPTHGTHGPHIPLGAVTHNRPSQIGQIKKYPPSSKPSIQVYGKRNVKPIRVQTSTHSNRDEVFTASATSGVYTLLKPNNIKTRETIGLGLPVGNHYSINQPHAHIEFTNRFALPPTSESVFEQFNPLQGFIFTKHPQTNDVNYQFHNQNDEYTRNLVPPPLYKNKDPINQHKQTQNDGSDKSQILVGKSNIPENVIVQLPPPFQFAPPKANEPVQVQVTKEKLNVFHNNIPPNYNGEYVDYDFHSVRKPTEISKQTYEVTEGKLWQETPQYSLRPRKPTTQPKRHPQVELNVPQFLPTPYRPEGQGILPTSPTQSEVSTIFTKLSQQMFREKQMTTPNPFSFDTKEVSTHYPIFGKPIFDYDTQTQEITNDITTKQEEVITTTRETPRVRPHRRRRPMHRTTTTTTTTEEPIIETENYDLQRTQENETSESVETERPIRQRRPTRYRTTTPSSVESEEVPVKVTRGRNRYRHRPTEAYYEPVRKRVRPTRLEIITETPENHRTILTESSPTEMTESAEMASEKSEEIEEFPKTEIIELELPDRHYVTESVKKIRYETIRPIIEATTTEKAPTTNLIVPENEIDLTSDPSIEETTIATTPPTTTTTTTASPHRIRGRPIKFDNSNRPRFSVKDYRQKLSQYTATSTAEPYKTTSESLRIRLPSRLRRPSSTIANNEEESTEPIRSKFIPKEPRHAATTEDTNEAIITEKNVKSVNTRLRPFSRYRSTIATTTSLPKVSIKPNLFTRRRPPLLNLRTKIYNKHLKNGTETTTEKITTTEEGEIKETTLDYDQGPVEEMTTESNWKKTKTTEEFMDDIETTTVTDISKIDSYLYSQRVSDLTSSSKNEYNTPGLFKSVSPTSRRIPNYFTIATDDPILPIEAFFPNIKDKGRDKDS